MPPIGQAGGACPEDRGKVAGELLQLVFEDGRFQGRGSSAIQVSVSQEAGRHSNAALTQR